LEYSDVLAMPSGGMNRRRKWELIFERALNHPVGMQIAAIRRIVPLGAYRPHDRVNPMKIAVSTKGTDLHGNVAPFPGQGVGFVIYDVDHFSFSTLDNKDAPLHLARKADSWSERMADAGVDVLVVSGMANDVARQVRCAGIKIYECISATVWEAIQALRLNVLRTMDADPGTPDTWDAVED
jgi:predicted Fe-Mo cluster-binding NifX family protein